MQGTEEWKQARVGKATASEAHKIMMKPDTAGYQQYSTQIAIERIIGEPQGSDYENDYMRDGREFEEVAAVEYELAHNKTQEVGFISHPELEAGASPDKLVGDDGQLEIKNMENHIYMPVLLNQFIPGQYYKQIQFQLWITNRSWCDFVAYARKLPEQLANLNMAVIRVERNEDMINQIDHATRNFLSDVEELEKKIRRMM